MLDKDTYRVAVGTTIGVATALGLVYILVVDKIFEDALPKDPPLRLRRSRKSRTLTEQSTPQLPLHADPPPIQSTVDESILYVDTSTMPISPPTQSTLLHVDESIQSTPLYVDKPTMTSPPLSPAIQSTLLHFDEPFLPLSLPIHVDTESPHALHTPSIQTPRLSDTSPETRSPLSPLHVKTHSKSRRVTSSSSVSTTSTVSTPSTIKNREQLIEKTKEIRHWPEHKYAVSNVS